MEGLFVHELKTLNDLMQMQGDRDKSGLAQALHDGYGADNIKNFHPNPSKRPDYPNFTIIHCEKAGNGIFFVYLSVAPYSSICMFAGVKGKELQLKMENDQHLSMLKGDLVILDPKCTLRQIELLNNNNAKVHFQSADVSELEGFAADAAGAADAVNPNTAMSALVSLALQDRLGPDVSNPMSQDS